VLPANDTAQWPCSISPDGKWLLYTQNATGNADLWLAPLDRPAEAKALINTPSAEPEGHFSPDGRWIAYLSNESGRYEVYVRRFPIGDDRIQISNTGASVVRWSPDGRELFYRAGSRLMAVQIRAAGESLEPSTPEPLFSVSDNFSVGYTVAPDGRRFLFSRATGSDQVSVILNWKRTIPAQ
jgi:Tol biopolymer transport system component